MFEFEIPGTPGKEFDSLHELKSKQGGNKMGNNNNEYKYFKLIKESLVGEKIGYYNSDIDPEDSWPTEDVDLAQILTKEQVKSVMVIQNLMNKHYDVQYKIRSIGVY